MNLKLRAKQHLNISSKLATLNNKEIKELLKDKEVGDGWGKNHIIKIGNKKVFVKSIPLTDLEFNNPFETKNLFKLPLSYNYGVGSAGFGAYRELITHIKTTNWVLSGECESFPLMHHYRIVKKGRPLKKLTKKQRVQQDGYIKYWGGSKNIDNYITQRKLCEYQIVIFLEYIPHSFYRFLKKNLNKVKPLNDKAIKGFNFLNKKGITHFDAHFGNVLTNGTDVYITDFGLALDKDFNLTEKELEFLKDHKKYDQMELIGCSSTFLESLYQDLNQNKKSQLKQAIGLTSDLDYYQRLDRLIKNLDTLNAFMKLDTSYLNYLKTNLRVIKKSNHFFKTLRDDPKKRHRYY